MKRLLSPATNSPGLLSAAAAIYAAVIMVINVRAHHAAVDPKVIVAALSAAGYLVTRFYVTPTADPKDGAGRALLPLKPLPPGHGLSDAERRRAENLRLMHAPGTPSFYPHPGETTATPTAPPSAAPQPERRHASVKGTTARGFAIYDQFTDRYGHRVRIQRSSLASEDAVWIFTSEGGTDGAADGAAHLTVEMAKRVRDALDEFISGAVAQRGQPVPPMPPDGAR